MKRWPTHEKRGFFDFILSSPERAGNEPFLLAPGRPALTYFRLIEQLEHVSGQLAASGLKSGDRIAVVMDNGPELATALLSVMLFSTMVPLNPAFSEAELSYYLENLRVRAVLCDSSSMRVMRTICNRMQIPCLVMVVEEGSPAGIFRLLGDGGDLGFSSLELQRPASKAIAAIFLTSGTSARAKLVPLSHENIGFAANNVMNCFSMAPGDRAVNVIGFFHIHGFVSVLAATAVSGGSVVCLPRFEAKSFFQVLSEYKPTWYTAGPTVHRAIVEYAKSQTDWRGSSSLRCIRSGSAPLNVNLMLEMEELFSAPVLEAFGMTETASTIISNPLPPGKRVPGSVGLPVGCEVRIVDAEGNSVTVGSVGEITLRGPTVFDGYEVDGVIAPTLVDGWFHTGDLGYVDSDGYIFIAGRKKEMINRGGQKIAPPEVDEVLMEMPQIREAACFGIPHPRLGEDVAAAVVLEPGAVLLPETLRAFLGERLAAYKIPRRICFVEFLPKGPTGKLLRSTLASLTERNECVPYEAPRTETEKWLAEIWCGLLDVDCVSVQDDFFELGGDSLLSERLMVEVSTHCQKVFPETILLEVGTIASLAARIDQAAVTGDIVIPLQPLGSRVPLFCFHAIYGDLGSYAKLVEYMGRDQPIYGVRFFAGMGKAAGKETLCELVETYAVALKNKQPQGPYRLVGYSFGGILALETARRLVKDGNEVEFIALIDTDLSEYLLKGRHNFRYVLKYWSTRLMQKWPMFWRMSWSEKREYVFQKIRLEKETRKKARDHRRNLKGARIELGRLASLYSPAIYNGEVRLFHVMGEKDRFLLDRDGALGWTPWVTGGVKVIYVPGDHTTVMQDPNIATLAKKLIAEIEALDCIGSV